MRGKKKLLGRLPGMTVMELILCARDCRRAADAAAIGGASDRQWYEYYEVFNEIQRQLGKICQKRVREASAYLDRGPVKESFDEDGTPVVEDKALYIKLLNDKIKRLEKELEAEKKKNEETSGQLHRKTMLLDASRDYMARLYAIGRRMHLNLSNIHNLFFQCDVASLRNDKFKDNLCKMDRETDFVRNGEDSFPMVGETLSSAKILLKQIGEERVFDDYIGWHDPRNAEFLRNAKKKKENK